jgi:putative endonuclease
MYYVYIMPSLKDGTFYKGSTSDRDARLKSHDAGKVRSTKSGRPWILHYSESFHSKIEAIQREHFFKSYEGYLWLKKKEII